MRMPILLVFGLALATSPLVAQTEIYDGRPSFSEGVDLGYYVWRDGDTWRVRWTTKGQMRHFSGAVTAEGGELKSLKRIDVESESRVLYPGRSRRVVVGPRGKARVVGGRAPVVATREQDKSEKDGDHRIGFSARTNDDLDGFDFKVDDKVTSLRFVLNIDNRAMPILIELGRNNQKAGTLPLVVRLR